MLGQAAPRSADAWHRRAIASEEIVGGLRVVIGERSQALNQRTKQANELAGRLGLTRTELSRSRVSVGALTRRQRQLARENARADAALRKQRAALQTTASQLTPVPRVSALSSTRSWPRSPRRSPPTRGPASRVARVPARASTPTWSSSVEPARVVAAGLVAAVLLAGCSTVVKEPPSEQLQISAPLLVEVDPVIESAAPAPSRALSRRAATAPCPARDASDPQQRARRRADRFGLRARLEDAARASGRPTGHEQAEGRSAEGTIGCGERIERLSPRRVRHRPGRAPASADAAGRGTPAGASVVVVGYPLGAKPRLSRGFSSTACPERRSVFGDACCA